MTSIAKWTKFLIPLTLIILMTYETLKLVLSKQDYGHIMSTYIINILIDLSI